MRVVSEKQYTPEYFDAHRGIPGASEAEHVATKTKGDYPASARTLICKLIADQYDPGYGMYEATATAAMRHGLFAEPQARASLQFELDQEIREVGFCVTDDGHFGCSPDGLIGEDGGIEFKVPDHKTHVGYLLAGTLPSAYVPQVHWSLIVTGRKWWKWVSWNPYLPPVIVHVEPDDFTEKLRANMARFWKEYQEAVAFVTRKIPPPPAPEIVEYAGFGPVEIPAFVPQF